MANIRQLKKDVDNQVFGIISDSLLYMGLHPGKDTDAAGEIIHEAVALRNNLFERINHPAVTEDAKALKNHFREIKKDLSEGIDGLCVKLSKLSSAKKKK